MLELPAEQEPAVGTIILLHGWGASAPDLMPLAQALRLPYFRYLFPEGQFDVPETGGYGKGWFSFPPTDESQRERECSRRQIYALLDNLCKDGIPASRVVLMGFSQGASVSLDVALTYPHQVAGVVVMSGFLIDAHTLGKRNDLPLDIPIFAAHGTLDPILPIQMAKASILALRDVGFQVEWHEYPMDHRTVVEELEDIRRFLGRIFLD